MKRRFCGPQSEAFLPSEFMRKTTKQAKGRKANQKGETAEPAKTVKKGIHHRSGKPGAPIQSPYSFLGWTSPVPSVETVANLAAKLIKGEDMGAAVDRALTLLEISAEEIFLLNALNNGERQGDQRELTFKEGAKEITGQKRTDRAIEYLQDFFAAMVAEIPEMNTEAKRRKKLSDWITKKEKEGFTGEEATRARAKYRRFKKKSLR